MEYREWKRVTWLAFLALLALLALYLLQCHAVTQEQRLGLLQENAYIEGWEQGRIDYVAETIATIHRIR